jgi:hypothetical protein
MALRARWAAWAMSTGDRRLKASSTSMSSKPPSRMTTTSVKPSGAAECPGLNLPEVLCFWTSQASLACPAAFSLWSKATSVTTAAKESPMRDRPWPGVGGPWAGALGVPDPRSAILVHVGPAELREEFVVVIVVNAGCLGRAGRGSMGLRHLACGWGRSSDLLVAGWWAGLPLFAGNPSCSRVCHQRCLQCV